MENTQVYLTITQALLREGNRRFEGSFDAIPKSALRKTLRDDNIP